jgi:excisionase family DNA binding protein
MITFNSNVSPLTTHNHISVSAASIYSGYSQQYLRRLLRGDRLASIKVGQLWLIDKKCFDTYLKKVRKSQDRRFGPK